jgi:hypothetical protein
MTPKNSASTTKPLGIYLTGVWVAINIALTTYMILTHPEEPNSFIEILLWVPSIAGLLLMKKWGALLTATTLSITLGISLSGLLLTFNSSSAVLTFVPINALRVAVNAVAIIYLFKVMFSGRFT